MLVSEGWLNQGVGSIKPVEKMHKLDVGQDDGSRHRDQAEELCGMWSRVDAAQSCCAA